MENKEIYTREEVINILQNMQKETCNCVGFIAGTVTQLWVVKDLIGKRLEDMGSESIPYKIK